MQIGEVRSLNLLNKIWSETGLSIFKKKKNIAHLPAKKLRAEKTWVPSWNLTAKVPQIQM